MKKKKNNDENRNRRRRKKIISNDCRGRERRGKMNQQIAHTARLAQEKIRQNVWRKKVYMQQ